MDCILVRYGEISLKSDFVRAEFERILMRNISEALIRNGFHVEKIVKHGARMFVFCQKLEKAIKILQNVFGIVSLSPVYIVRSDIMTFKEWAMKVYSEESKKAKKSFRITVRRQDKSFPMESMEVGRVVGEHVLEKSGAKVDLHSPEININLEIAMENTYIFSRVYKCWGGLPIGSQGRVLCLFDGSKYGILSILEMIRRGCTATVICNKKTDVKKLYPLAKNYYICDEKLRVYLGKPNIEELARFEAANAIAVPLYFKKIGEKELKSIKKQQAELPLFLPLIGHSKDETSVMYKKLNLSAKQADKFVEICKNIYTKAG